MILRILDIIKMINEAKFERIMAPDWKVETAIMYYYSGHDLETIEKNLFTSGACIYRWIDILGLEKRGYDK